MKLVKFKQFITESTDRLQRLINKDYQLYIQNILDDHDPEREGHYQFNDTDDTNFLATAISTYGPQGEGYSIEEIENIFNLVKNNS